MEILKAYHAGLARTKARIVASENWWKLRNTAQERQETALGKDGGFVSRSGWLHNVIVSKHADAMEDYPEPVILPREPGDQGVARMLTAILPCVLEQNQFEEVYSDVMWQKMKFGTGVYKVVWDPGKLGGLGDIRVEKVNILNLYWEPGVTDIQKSRYFFHAELMSREALLEQFPELEGQLKAEVFTPVKFLYDDSVSAASKVAVIEVYYHKGGLLHYAKFAGGVLLYATENDPELCTRGLYDHGRYPYEFDALFPIEGSPCGYGYVDVCRSPQTEIDLLKTSFVRNAMVGSTPRYFARSDGKINEEEFLDLSNPIVHVAGTLDETALRQVSHSSLDGSYIQVLRDAVDELRETSGNTETATGNISSGVTAASAIAALQEASGKGSRDSTRASYRAFSEIVELCIELIRQFYDMPRQFRIVGQYGMERYISYSNAGLRPQYQGRDFGEDMGYRLPVFDIKISAQKKNVYTRVTQNELALQLFDKGFFNPRLTDQAMMCLDMMEFDGKDGLMRRVAQNGTLFRKLTEYMQLALALAAKAAPEMVQGLSRDITETVGGAGRAGGGSAQMLRYGAAAAGGRESALVENARARSEQAPQPRGGGVTGGRKS